MTRREPQGRFYAKHPSRLLVWVFCAEHARRVEEQGYEVWEADEWDDCHACPAAAGTTGGGR